MHASLEIRHGEERGRGFFATAAIAKGEVLMSLPRDRLLIEPAAELCVLRH